MRSKGPLIRGDHISMRAASYSSLTNFLSAARMPVQKMVQNGFNSDCKLQTF
jgi:hypothetical protein